MINLFVVAHPDDEVLGCGGTMFLKTKKGEKVVVLYLADGEMARRKGDINKRKTQARKVGRILNANQIFENFPDNQLDTIPLLEVVQTVERVIKEIKPNTIFTHHVDDLNVDHRITYEAVLTATRPGSECFVPNIYAFEVLSSTHWTNGTNRDTFSPNYFVDISDVIEKKLELMDQYKDELREYPHPRSVEGIKTLGKFRGMQIGCEYAEGYSIVRKIETI